MPDIALRRSDTLLSFGINLDWSFELAAQKRFPELTLETYDKTTSFGYALWWGLTRFLYSPISKRAHHFRALRKPIDYYSFFSGPNVHHHRTFVGPKSCQGMIGIDAVLAKYHDRQLFLKIDIEGMEYEILDTLMTFHSQISGLAVEFHNVNADRRFQPLVARIQQHLWISHMHVNNADGLIVDGLPRLLEITFVSKEIVANPAQFTGTEYSLPIDAKSSRQRRNHNPFRLNQTDSLSQELAGRLVLWPATRW